MTEIATKTLIVPGPVPGSGTRIIKGQPVPPDLVDAYNEAGGNIEDQQDSVEPRIHGFSDDVVIAGKTRLVFDKAMGIHRRVIKGQPVPPDLVDAYNSGKGGAAAKEIKPPADPPASGNENPAAAESTSTSSTASESDMPADKTAVEDGAPAGIKKYDELNAKNAVKAVTADNATEIKAYEAAHKNRVTVIGACDAALLPPSE